MSLSIFLWHAPVLLCLGIAFATGRRTTKIVWVLCGVGIVAIANLGSERSATLDVGGGVKLTHSIRWGWDMQQTIGISGPGLFDFGFSLSEDVWNKPYNAGGPLFRTADGTVCHLGLLWNTYRISIADRTIVSRCGPSDGNLMHYVGQFGLAETQELSCGAGARFTPAGQGPPARTGVLPDRDALREKCG